MAEEQDSTAHKTLAAYCLNLFDRMSEKLASSLESKINDINLNLTTEEKISVAITYRQWVEKLHYDKELGLLINNVLEENGNKYHLSKYNPKNMFKESAENSGALMNDLIIASLTKSNSSFGAHRLRNMQDNFSKLENDRALVHDLIVASLTEIGSSSGAHILKKMQDNFSQLEIPGFEVEPVYLPRLNGSNYVSGDTIIYFEKLNENGAIEYLISLVDVSGKEGAVKDALDAKAYFLIYNTPGKELKETYNTLNDIFCERFKDDNALYSANRFVSAESILLPKVIKGQGSVEIKAVAAGNKTLVYRSCENEIKTESESEDVSDLLLGIFPSQDYQEHKMQLSCGDILLLYTDGLTETRNEQGDLFEMDRIKDIIENNKNNHPQDIARELKNAVTAFANGNRSDDISFIVIKYTGLS